MIKMARGNYDAMVKTLQGYLVWQKFLESDVYVLILTNYSLT
jgi:hypothetical protein